MSKKPNVKTVRLHRTDKPVAKGEKDTKLIGGSPVAEFNDRVLSDAVRAFWNPKDDPEGRWLTGSVDVAIHGLIGIEPKTEHEGLLAAQLVASYAASMECFRRAAIPDLPHEARKDNLHLATKSARTFAALTETLLKLRGEGPKQSVHVHHHHHDARTQIAAETANVMLNAPEGGGVQENDRQAHEYRASAPRLEARSEAPIHPSAPMRRKEPTREPVPRTGDGG